MTKQELLDKYRIYPTYTQIATEAFEEVGGKIMVATDLNKKSDRFIIYDNQ